MWFFGLVLIVLVLAGALYAHFKRETSAQKKKELAEAEREIEERREKMRPTIEAREKLAAEYQAEIDKGWQVFVNSNKPVATVSVAKIGHEDKYHIYFDPDDAEVGDKAEVYYDQQYFDDFDNFRDAYVVSIDDRDVGELTEGTINKIDQYTPWDDAAYAVAKVREDSAGKIRLSLNVFERYEEIPGHRTWPMNLRGTNYDGRAETVRENGPTICKLDATTYEGEPAVRVLDVLDRELGWVPKEYAEEVIKYINKGKISEARIDNIEVKDDKIYAVLFLLIKNYL